MNNLKLLVGIAVALLLGGLLLFYKPSIAPAPYGEPSDGAIQTAPSQTTGGTGVVKAPNVVFAIKDKASSLEGLQSVVMQVKEISVLTPKKGWVPVISSPMSFDLLQLKEEGTLQMLSEINLDPGTYTQIRFVIGAVLVTQNNVPKTAKLPSGELKMLTNLVVEKDKKSAVEFDFQVDKSLHVTGEGKYIFAPVINLKTLTDVYIQKSGKTGVDVVGGVGKFNGDMGMDEAGNFGTNLSIDPNADLNIVNDILVVVPKSANRDDLKISVETAIGAALNQRYVDKVIFVRADTYLNRTVWRVLGVKGSKTVKVYVDGTIGEIIGAEY